MTSLWPVEVTSLVVVYILDLPKPHRGTEEANTNNILVFITKQVPWVIATSSQFSYTHNAAKLSSRSDPMQHPNASLILAPLTQMKEKLNQGVGGRQLDRPVAAISHFYLHLFWLKTQQIS